MTVSNQKVLIADDDPAMVRLLAKWLETAGYQTQKAGDGRQAMAAIENDCPHILVTDWEMPNMDGLALCRWLRQQTLPHYVYTVFLTVRNGLDDIIKGLEAGADDFLKKPIDRGELIARLKTGERLVELERRLSSLAFTDSLTGLLTQRTFYENLNREWNRSERYTLPLTCVMMDIDYFKRINDSHGHPVGDEVIRQVAKVLREKTRVCDYVSRYGGEEFCIALPETDENQAQIWAERVREAIGEIRLTVGEKELRITASFGIAQRLDDTRSYKELVELADQALLVAKRSGRDRVVTYRSVTESSTAFHNSNAIHEVISKLPARVAMTSIIAGLNQNQTIGDAARYFLRFRINSAPVVDDSGNLVGILSERDLMTTTLAANWWTTPICAVMKHNVVAYEEDASLATIYDFLARVSIRSVVIVQDRKPIGMMSRATLLRWFVNHLNRGRPMGGNQLVAAANDVETREELSSNLADQRLQLTAEAIAAEAQKLVEDLRNESEDLVPCMIGGASRIQEMVNDLLAYSRYMSAPKFAESEANQVVELAARGSFDSSATDSHGLLASWQHIELD